MNHFSNFKSNELNQLKNTTLNKEPIISYYETVSINDVYFSFNIKKYFFYNIDLSIRKEVITFFTK